MESAGPKTCELIQLEQRCRSHLRSEMLRSLLARWSLLCWVGGSIVLLGFVVAKALGYPLAGWLWLLLGWALSAFVYSLWWVRRQPATPLWSLLAFLDRHGNQQGRLMRAAELQSPSPSFPNVLLRLALPRARRKPVWPGWLCVFASTALLYWVPSSQRLASSTSQRLPPVHVQRAEQQLTRVAKADPEARAFVAEARKALARMKSQSTGLSRSDFEAIERIQAHSKRLLRRKAQAANAQRAAISALEQMAASQEAGPNGAGKGSSLAEQVQRSRDALTRGGLSPQDIQQLLQQARKLDQQRSEGKGSGKAAGGQDRAAFGKQAIARLKQAMGEMKRIGPGGSLAGNGPGESGPAFTPLTLAGKTQPADGAQHENITFSTQGSRDTVLLSMARSQREEAPHRDGPGAPRTFEEGGRSVHSERNLSPRHRAVLRAYFGESK